MRVLIGRCPLPPGWPGIPVARLRVSRERIDRNARLNGPPGRAESTEGTDALGLDGVLLRSFASRTGGPGGVHPGGHGRRTTGLLQPVCWPLIQSTAGLRAVLLRCRPGVLRPPAEDCRQRKENGIELGHFASWAWQVALDRFRARRNFLPSPVSRLPSPVSRLPSPVSRLPSPVSRLPSPVSRLPSPVSRPVHIRVPPERRNTARA